MRGFRNRREAGLALAGEVAKLDLEDPVVLGLPRGGVVVAAPIADRLNADLDVVVARKLGVPFHPEFGFGAIAERGVQVVDGDTVDRMGLDETQIEQVVTRERVELDRRAAAYRAGRATVPLDGRGAVLVDDGVATGGTMRASIESARRGGAARVIVAVPVAAREALAALPADQVVCLLVPEHFEAVGLWYRDFTQSSDQDVVDALAAAQR